MNKSAELIPMERIQNYIFLIRGEKVLLGQQLAELYGVPVKVLVQAVKRNRERFPEDFVFLLTRQEFTSLKSQIVTSSWGGLRRAMPYAFNYLVFRPRWLFACWLFILFRRSNGR